MMCFNFKNVWTKRLEGETINDIDLSEQYIAIGTESGYVYILDWAGKLIRKIDRIGIVSLKEGACCNRSEPIVAVKYCCSKLFFKDFSNLYVMSEDGKKLIKVIKAEGSMITPTKDGVMVCGLEECSFYSFDGEKLWGIKTDLFQFRGSPIHYGDYWILPDNSRAVVLVVNEKISLKRGTKKVVRTITKFRSPIFDMDLCGNYLVVSDVATIHLIDLSNPLKAKRVWKRQIAGVMFSRVAFNKSCRLIAFIASLFGYGGTLNIFTREGSIRFAGGVSNRTPNNVKWWNDQLVIVYDHQEMVVKEKIHPVMRFVLD